MSTIVTFFTVVIVVASLNAAIMALVPKHCIINAEEFDGFFIEVNDSRIFVADYYGKKDFRVIAHEIRRAGGTKQDVAYAKQLLEEEGFFLTIQYR